ncbi:MAG: ATP-binding cassette domain-containing protein, partial [bacterium]|nr:ATP-binding cassette domain-containing protein [bacterium]
MIQINNLSFSYGAQTIFSDTSLTIDDCKNGLVGRNGSGKSTFFNLVSGNLIPEDGNISISNSGKIAYLKQAMSFDDVDMLPHEFVLSNIAFYNNYNALLEKLENTESPDLELLHEFSEVESVFNNHNGYKLKEDVIQVLESLGFKKEANKRIFELSYGFKMRLFLAKLLLDESEILLLDEPTNHLDLPSIKFVEEYLKRIKKLCIIVSHDRAFLDSVCERTLELNNKKIKKYNGNYSFFKNQKEAAILQTEKERENLMGEKARLEEMIARIKDNVKKVNIASSRQKFVDKIDDKLGSLEDFSKKEVSFLRRDEVLRSDIGFKVEIKEKSYDKQRILEDIEVVVRPTDRIFLIGANGYGKSTLLRIIASRDSNFTG